MRGRKSVLDSRLGGRSRISKRRDLRLQLGDPIPQLANQRFDLLLGEARLDVLRAIDVPGLAVEQ